jgi:predicted nucleic acid-binding protein
MTVHSDRLFIDTNVLVYAYDRTAGIKYETAQKLLEGLWRNKSACVSIQVLKEFFVIVTRRIKMPLPAERAAQIIADLGQWQVHRPDVQDVLSAIELHRRYQTSFWDALILQSASKLNCSTVYSEDLNAGQMYYGVQVINPFVEPI